MDTGRNRGILLGAGLIAIALAGVTGIALAASNRSPALEVGEATPDNPSSVTFPASQADTETADEGKALRGLAKITPDQAKAAALAAAPGNATKVELENKDGNVVYAVEVTGADGKVTDLEIDAGNGAVLSKETEADTPEGEDATAEVNEPPKANEPAEAPETPELPDTSDD